jgi:hypothetical protein
MSNSQGVLTEGQIKEQASKAFGDSHAGKALGESAGQRMAYVVLAMREHLADSGVSIAALSTTLTSKDATSDVRSHMVAHLADAPMDTSAGRNDKTAQANVMRTDQLALIARGIKLAGILDANNITYRAFDTKAGYFNLPLRMLLDASKSERPTASRNIDSNVLLNDRAILITSQNDKGDEVMRNIRTSEARLRALHMPKADRKPGGKTDDASSGLAQHLVAAALIINEPHDGEPLTAGDHSEAELNALAAIVQYYDALMAASKPKPKRKAKADNASAAA